MPAQHNDLAGALAVVSAFSAAEAVDEAADAQAANVAAIIAATNLKNLIFPLIIIMPK